VRSLYRSSGQWFSVPDRKLNHEARSDSWCAGRGDRAAVPFHNAPADCEANARPAILVAAVQAFKHLEDLFGVLLLESDAVVCHRERADRSRKHFCAHAHDDRTIRATVLECIRE